MRRVAFGSVLGGLPGMLIALVPLLLHGAGLITSDQSQIGFIGIPLMFLGVFIGGLAGASGTPYAGRVALGLGLGFVVGLAGGAALTQALTAAGWSVPGLPFLVAPAMMVAGGVLAARQGTPRAGDRTGDRSPPVGAGDSRSPR